MSLDVAAERGYEDPAQFDARAGVGHVQRTADDYSLVGVHPFRPGRCRPSRSEDAQHRGGMGVGHERRRGNRLDPDMDQCLDRPAPVPAKGGAGIQRRGQIVLGGIFVVDDGDQR